MYLASGSLSVVYADTIICTYHNVYNTLKPSSVAFRQTVLSKSVVLGASKSVVPDNSE